MKLLEERIIKEGVILPGNVLKVGSFLNQQIDPFLLDEIGNEIYNLFSKDNPTKILTIESSGIAFATTAGLKLHLPIVFAKKHHTSNMDGEYYCADSHSYTHNNDYTMMVNKDYISPTDRILIVDDFLAVGGAMNGLISIVNQSGAKVAGICAAIEKCFQGGGDKLREEGYHVESLALVESMTDNTLTFRK